MITRLTRIVCLLVTVLLVAASVPALAQAGGGTVSGVVVDQADGLPIPAANLGLDRGDAVVATGKSDQKGAFEFDSVEPGAYTLSISATGYQSSNSRQFVVAAGQTTTVSLAVTRASQSVQRTNLKTIGSVTASATSPIASTTTITRTLDPAVLQNENYLNFVGGLTRLPGVNSTGLSSSVSDDSYLDIRGLGESETQALLDGHPVGPQGVYGINGGGSFPTAFNYSDSPIFGLSRVQVTFGSGASGLYGVDAIGGTVDMETLNPTRTPQENFWEGLGDQGRQMSAFNATGSAGRLSYALAGGVQGTYGMFAPQLIPQTGRPNNNGNANNGGACAASNDISPCNLALNTYSVSQNSTLRSGLAKFKYDLSNNTTFTTTVFTSGQLSDSTGNGDNDNIPYDTRLAYIYANDTPNCSLPGDAKGKMSGYQVITVANPANNPTACYSAQKWALASYGPDGGGADRKRGADTADYDFKLQSTTGKNTITADGYYNYYKFFKSSEESAGLDPTGTEFAGDVYSQFINSQGYLVSDDIVNANSDIGFGYFGEYQVGNRLNYNSLAQGIANYIQPESTHYNSGFARASYNFTNKLSAYGNFWVKNDTAIGDTNFDPRLSLVLRPQSSDVFRVTYGHSTGDPAAELKATGPPDITVTPQSVNVVCNPFNTIGNGGNPSIKPEASNDYEVGYAHRFGADSSVQFNAYYTSVHDQLFSADDPISSYGSVAVPARILQQLAQRFSTCPGVDPSIPASVLPYLAITTTYNAASAISKGIELSGRQHISPHVYFDYSYDIQSVVQNGINIDILQNNPFVINGGQVQGIPINQATVGLDYTYDGFEARLDGYIVGSNNASARPAYNSWNGFISKTYKNGLTLNLGVQNVFNQAWQQYGYFGHAPLTPENQYYHDTTPIAQYVSVGNEEFGIPVRSFEVTANYHI